MCSIRTYGADPGYPWRRCLRNLRLLTDRGVG
jgi:hypothetical protein